MIGVSAVGGEPDLAEWVRLRNEVDPHEAATLEEMAEAYERSRGELLLLLAELDGEAVGCSTVVRSESLPTSCFVLPRVVPGARRCGVGTALLRAGSEHARALGCAQLASRVDGADEASWAFAASFGFVEAGRQVELVRPIGRTESPPATPRGIELSPLRPEHVEGVRVVARQAGADMPLPQPASDELVETWVEELMSGAAAFVALRDGEVVGFAGLADRPARGACAENNLTAVRRDFRGRGIAVGLKQALVHWASEHDYTELQTWTQDGNAPMQAVNERVGYRPGLVSVTVRGPLLT